MSCELQPKIKEKFHLITKEQYEITTKNTTYRHLLFGLILSRPHLTVNPAGHIPCFEPWPHKGMNFPALQSAGQLGVAPRTPRRGKESTGSSPETPPVTHTNLNYHQVKQNTRGGERILYLPLTSGRCNPQPWRDPGCEKLRIPRHFQWENPQSWERHTTHSAAISWVSPLCVTVLCSQHWN